MNIPILENEIVRLEPLGLHNYKNLYAIASEKDILQYSPSDISTFQALTQYTKTALTLWENNQVIPFIIYDKRVRQYAGSTRYLNIDWTNKIIEIGATWIGSQFRGTGLNGAMKNLMIQYAFKHLEFEKIVFRIDQRNIASRKAVEKLGAQLEGILREDVYLTDGYKRNSCYYGILKKEWLQRSK